MKRLETVGVSAGLVEATPEWSDRMLSSISNNVMVVAEGFQLDDGTRSESDLPPAAATSPVVFAEYITVGVMLPTVAGAASLATLLRLLLLTQLPCCHT